MTNLEIIRTYELHAPLCTTSEVYRTSSQTTACKQQTNKSTQVGTIWFCNL